MTSWVAVWFVVAVVTLVAVAVCVIALVRQVITLGRNARFLQDEIRPITGAISAHTARAADRAGSRRRPAGRRS